MPKPELNPEAILDLYIEEGPRHHIVLPPTATTEMTTEPPKRKEKKIPNRKPIMAKEVEETILNAIAQFTNAEKWEEYGMHELRQQGACILFEGPPGCGKTVIARWAARMVKKGWQSVNVADIAGGGSPGEAEAKLQGIFTNGHNHKDRTLFFDECDHILRRRADITGDALTWMVGTAEILLTEIANYPGMIILASNFADVLDPALDRRLLARVHIGRPDQKLRGQLWRAKLPKTYPFRPSKLQFFELSEFDLSGAQIENVIINATGEAIRKGVEPSIRALRRHCIIESDRYLQQLQIQTQPAEVSTK